MTHRFDASNFCLDCGQSREHVADHGLECFGGAGSNIVAISHRRSAQRFGEMLGGIRVSEPVTDIRTSLGIDMTDWLLMRAKYDKLPDDWTGELDGADTIWKNPA